MRRLEHLISQVRRQTDNEVIGDDDGISKNELIWYFNEAQTNLQEAIINTYRKSFSEVAYISAVGSQEEYSLPDYTFSGQSVVKIDYSHDGQAKNYIPLNKVEFVEQRSINGVPLFYVLRKNKVIFNPIPQSSITNAFRVTYNKALPMLDVRRSTVKAKTEGAGTLTALTLEPTFTGFSVDDWADDDYLTVIGADGTIKCPKIAYTAVSALGVLTMPTHTYLTGETVTVGDYVVPGERATTHSELPDNCERYLVSYVVWKILKRDSSKDSQEHLQELVMMSQQIVDTYAGAAQDITRIPVINTDWSEYV